jgi:tetratricopeptide (TPR) repeat protein
VHYTDATPMAPESGHGGRSTVLLLTVRRLPAVCAILSLCLTAPSSAQSPQPAAASPFEAAARALNLGQYDQVQSLLRSSADPRAIALRARAESAQGRYAEAEKLLIGPAGSAPGSDAGLELGLLQMRLGRRADATRTLQGVLTSGPRNTPHDLTRLGLAARALGRFQEANGFFRDASAQAPDDPIVNTAWGELFLEKYNRPDAMKSFQSALRIDQDHVPARVGLARVLIEENPPLAQQAVDRALQTNPNYVPAHLFVAELALDDRRRDEARASIAKALAVNPNSLEARALDAAIAFLEGRTDEFESRAKEILAINPLYADAYRVAGDHAARNYRFAEAAELTRRALAVDRESTRSYADLGLHLLRTGDEPAARRSLETAFKADPFDVVTYNLLQMMDTLDKFETITEGDIIMRLSPDEAAVMREFVMPLAQQALATLSKQYQFKPQGPILIEMFPKHDDFAVRTLGLPGMIGALGACFGRVVTLDSPKARPPGQFSWAETLWHEMAHVITIQMSNSRVPRWLTEGTSMYEERRARPTWGRETRLSFAQSLGDEGKTMKLADLNDGFTDPQRISLAYYQSSLVVEHLIDTYGEPKFHEFIKAFGRGLENEEAIKTVYGVSIDQLQTSFDAKLEKDFAAVRAALKAPEIPGDATLEQLKALAASNPGSFRVQMQLAQAQREAADPAGAIQTLERASALIPDAGGQANPHALIAAIATERGDTARAIQALEAAVKVDYTDVEAARRLAALLEKQNDAARTAAAYQLVAELDPFDAQAQAYVGRVALKNGDTDRALRAFRAALAANPSDRAGAHIDLAEASFAAGQLDDAKRQALAALEIAPSFERAQDLLLKIVDPQPGARGGAR